SGVFGLEPRVFGRYRLDSSDAGPDTDEFSGTSRADADEYEPDRRASAAVSGGLARDRIDLRYEARDRSRAGGDRPRAGPSYDAYLPNRSGAATRRRVR